jgi:hypothetical protein
MATVTTYAEVLTPEHPQMKAYVAGIKSNPPGLLLRDVLQDTRGVYTTTTFLPESFRASIRRVAELSSDQELLRISDSSELPVSLEHLRGVDPAALIVIGCRLQYTADERRQLGVTEVRPDPRNTIEIDNPFGPF